MSSSNLHKLADKLSDKLAQQAVPVTQTQPVSAVVQNYAKLMDAYSRMLVNASSSFGDDAVQKAVSIVSQYKNTASQTAPENAKEIAKGLTVNIETVQNNLSEIKQLLAAIAAG